MRGISAQERQRRGAQRPHQVDLSLVARRRQGPISPVDLRPGHTAAFVPSAGGEEQELDQHRKKPRPAGGRSPHRAQLVVGQNPRARPLFRLGPGHAAMIGERKSSERVACQLQILRRNAKTSSAMLGPEFSSTLSSSRTISLRLISPIGRAPSSGMTSRSRVRRRRSTLRSPRPSRRKYSAATAANVSASANRCACFCCARAAAGSRPCSTWKSASAAALRAAASVRPPGASICGSYRRSDSAGPRTSRRTAARRYRGR